MQLRILALLIACALFWLAQSSWRNSHTVDLLELHPSKTGPNESASELRRQLDELNRRLDFMVWKDQRADLLKQKMDITQQLSNLEPLNAAHWRSLLSLSDQMSVNDDRDWSLLQMIKLQAWDNRSHWDLAYFCIKYFENLNSNAQSECNKFLAATSLRTKPQRVTGRLGLDLERVKRAFEEAGARP